MKRIIAMIAVTAVLLTGCGQLGKESETTKPGAEVQDTPFPETGTIGEYEYRIDNYKHGKAKRGYYLDEENRPDSPLYVYISGGEYSSGGHGLYITNIEVKDGNFIITVKQTSPEPDEVVTEAFEYPGCMVEISPKPSNIEVKNTSGVKFEYIDSSQSEPLEDIGESYYKEVSEEDIHIIFLSIQKYNLLTLFSL